MKARKHLTFSEVNKLIAAAKGSRHGPATGAGELPC